MLEKLKKAGEASDEFFSDVKMIAKAVKPVEVRLKKGGPIVSFSMISSTKKWVQVCIKHLRRWQWLYLGVLSFLVIGFLVTVGMKLPKWLSMLFQMFGWTKTAQQSGLNLKHTTAILSFGITNLQISIKSFRILECISNIKRCLRRFKNQGRGKKNDTI